MANYRKWLGGLLGWTLGGPIGMIVGFALGSFFDSSSKEARAFFESSKNPQANDFEISLLILSSLVIKADGKVKQSELNFVRDHFVKLFGKERANLAFRMFNEMMNKEVSLHQVCVQIRQYMSHASRLQLIQFLLGLALADGELHPSELDLIHRAANYFNISAADWQALVAMHQKDKDWAYKVLEIEPNASADEVKKAYRKMAKKFHPDRVSHLGEHLQEEATEKFKKVQEAYEFIQKQQA